MKSYDKSEYHPETSENFFPLNGLSFQIDNHQKIPGSFFLYFKALQKKISVHWESRKKTLKNTRPKGKKHQKTSKNNSKFINSSLFLNSECTRLTLPKVPYDPKYLGHVLLFYATIINLKNIYFASESEDFFISNAT